MSEHNRIVDAVKRASPGWTVETLIQEARKINIVQIQHIVYNEYLQCIQSGDVMTTHNLCSLKTGYSASYDKTRDATIFSDFGISYRVGHTWIPKYSDLYSDLNIRQTGPEMGPFHLALTYNNPHLMLLNGRTGCSALLKWLTSKACPSTDRVIEDSARNTLLEDSTGSSFDLAALNSNRGRDHGVREYDDYRIYFGLSALTENWDSLVDQNPKSVRLLSQVYDDSRDIDRFTGALTEIWLNGYQTGPNLICNLGREFQNLKEVDPYWYEREEPQ